MLSFICFFIVFLRVGYFTENNIGALAASACMYYTKK